MRKVFLGLAVAVIPTPPDAAAQCGVRLPALVDGVEAHLAALEDMSADFAQFQEDALNRTHREEGHLYLRRPRMMRWEYRTPEERLFVVNGGTMYSYAPADRQARRDSVGESFDDRVPILFLLGRSDLEGEFSDYTSESDVQVPGTCGMRMTPRRESEVEEVLLEVDPSTFDIRRMRLRFSDDSISDFVFGAIRTNRGLDDELFEFVPPPGVSLVDGF